MLDIHDNLGGLGPLIVYLAIGSTNTLVSLDLGVSHISSHDNNIFETLLGLDFLALVNFSIVAGPIEDTKSKQALACFLDRHASIRSLELNFRRRMPLDQRYGVNSHLFDPELLTPTSLAGLQSLKTDCVHLMDLLKSGVESLWKLKSLALHDNYDDLPNFVTDTFRQIRLSSVLHLSCVFGGSGSPELAAQIGKMCFNTRVYKLTFPLKYTAITDVGFALFSLPIAQ